MAKLKHQFNRIVEYFEQALEMALFAPLKRVLIFEARLVSWKEASKQGLPDPIPFRLNLSLLARKYRCMRPKLVNAHGDLILTNVFIPLGDGSFRINKDYRLWCDLRSGEPLFDADQLAILDGLRDSLQVYPKGYTLYPKGYSPDFPGCTQKGTGGVPKRVQFGPPPLSSLSPPEDRTKTEQGGVSAGTRESSPEGGAGGPPAPETRPVFASTPEEIRAIREWADRHCFDRSRWACDQAEEFPAHWVKAVLSRHVVAEREPKGPAYLNKLLLKWEKAGRCEYLDTSPVATNGHVEPPRRETTAERRRRERKESIERMKARQSKEGQ